MDAVEDVGETIVDGAEAVGSGIATVVDEVGPAAGAVGGAVGDTFGALATAIDASTGGALGEVLGATDDYIFDTVDYLSGGVVDIDFDDGTFSANIGVDGYAQAGASIGDNGVTAAYDTLGQQSTFGLGDQGIESSITAGVDYGPLPFVDGHVNLSPDGGVDVAGHLQGTVPTPYGVFTVDSDSGFQRTPDGGWGTTLNADGTWTLPSGTYIGGGTGFTHVETADGDTMTGVSTHAEIGEVGFGEVGASAGYQHSEVDGVTVDEVTHGVHAEGYGLTVEVDHGYTRVESDGDVIEDFTTTGSISGFGVTAAGGVGYTEATVGDIDVWRSDGDIDVDPAKLLSSAKTLLADEFADTSEPSGAAVGDDLAASDFDASGGSAFTTSGSPFDDPLGAGDIAAPIDDFTLAVDAADQIQDTAIDDMFDGLG